MKKEWKPVLIYGAILVVGLLIIKKVRDNNAAKKAAASKALQESNKAANDSGIIY